MKRKFLLIITTCLLMHLTSATAFTTSPPWNPRFSIDGYAGSASTAKLDVMLPLIGNQHSVFFADGQGKYGNDSAWLGSAGVGYRQLINNSQLWGAYIFVDKNVSEHGKFFWYVSPGVESLGTTWDFRSNIYLPTTEKKKFLRRLFADELGNTDFITFRGHQQFNHQVELYEVVGPGIDAEVGRVLPINNLKFFVGGYYFQPKQEDDIKGIAARVEFTASPRLTFMVSDTYDNYAHNTAAVGVKLTLGGTRDVYPSTDIRSRMLDPINRNLATLSTGSGVPIVEHQQDTGEVLQRDNIWFFNGASSAGTLDTLQSSDGLNAVEDLDAANAISATATNVSFSQGTYEHPFTAAEFNQAIINGIDQIAPGANLYFSPGNYHATNGVNPIFINAGQNLFGRTADYKFEATGNTRPNFLGAFIPEGNNRFESLILLKDNNTFANGFDIDDTSQILIRNVMIGSDQINNDQNFDVGILVNNSENIGVDGATINSLRSDSTPVAISVLNSSLVISNSSINAYFAVQNAGNLTAISIFQSSVSIMNSEISSVLQVLGDNNFIRLNRAVDISEDSSVSISGSHLLAYTTINGNSNDVSTVQAISLQASQLHVTNNDINAVGLVQLNNASTNQVQALFITAGLSTSNPRVISSNNSYSATATVSNNNDSSMSNAAYGILQDVSGTTTSLDDSINVTANVAGDSDRNSATGILLSENTNDNSLTVTGSIITTHATVGVNNAVVGDNSANGIIVRSSDSQVNVTDTTIDSNAIVTTDNAGVAINSARGFFIDTTTAQNYSVSIADSAIRAFASIPMGSTSPFNSASAISPLNDPNVTVINTTITEITTSS